MFMGYRTVTASAFFDVKTVDVRGTERAPKDAIENIVERESSKTGVWNADLAEIKKDVEGLTFVKTATVTRVLPDGVRINVIERVPKAVVVIGSNNYWADEEAVLLGKVDKNDTTSPFALRGWNGDKSVKADEENKLRMKMYLQMLEEWQDFEVAKKVSVVDMSNLQDIQAVVMDSGEAVSISLGSDEFGKRLRNSLKAIVGKGKEIRAFDGQRLVPTPRDS